MALRVQCLQCGKPCQIQPEHLGKSVRCGHCNAVFVASENKQPPPKSAPPAGGFWSGLSSMFRPVPPPFANPEADDVEMTLDLDGPAAALAQTRPPATEAVKGLRIDIGSATTCGRVRPRNEDSHAVMRLEWANTDQHHELALIVVADGMGGYEAGDKASGLVIQHITAGMGELFARGTAAAITPAQAAETIGRLLRSANTTVIQHAQNDPNCKSMGSTAAVVVIYGADVCLGHLGDCRVYHFSAGQLTQVTRDHTLVARMVELGRLTAEEALTHPQRNEVTQAIGRPGDIQPSAHQLKLAAGDWLLVACDGLAAHVDEAGLAAAVAAASPSACVLAQHLVDLANEGGGTDNCTVVAVKCW